jgi:hypothetical protein
VAWPLAAGAQQSDRVRRIGVLIPYSRGVPLPVAIYPRYVHARLRGQRSCFTIHGTDKRGLDSLLAGRPILKRYVVDPAYCQPMRSELAVLGITDTVVFPNIDGLASELKKRYS